jgi:hypothetical protein
MRDTLTEKVRFKHLRIGDYFMTHETDHVLVKTSYSEREVNHAWVNHLRIPMLGFCLTDKMVCASSATLDEIIGTLEEDKKDD